MSETKNKTEKLVLPDGQEVENSAPKTERSIERGIEEKQYLSVIIKRNDEFVKHPDDVLEAAIELGREQVNRPFLSLLLSAVSAGLILGFAALAVSFARIVVPSSMEEPMERLAMALVYPLGFVMVVMSGAQLFTEHTALAVYPFLEKKCNFLQLARLWGTVLIGNLLGTFLSSILIYLAEPVSRTHEGYVEVGNLILQYSAGQIVVSAILAGWLMALGSWLVLSTAEATAQIICIYIVTFLIGIGGLHHSIAGSAEVFVAYFLDETIGLRDVFSFLYPAVIGNLIGGSFFVAVLNYGHIRKTQGVPFWKASRYLRKKK